MTRSSGLEGNELRGSGHSEIDDRPRPGGQGQMTTADRRGQAGSGGCLRPARRASVALSSRGQSQSAITHGGHVQQLLSRAIRAKLGERSIRNPFWFHDRVGL